MIKLPKGINHVIPSQLKFVEFTKKVLLPEESGIYFVIHDNEIIYIGQAKSFKSRWGGNSHKVTKHILSENIGDKVKIHYLKKRSNVDDVEWYFICKFMPPLNIIKPHYEYEYISDDIEEFITLDVKVLESKILSVN
jgi:excinuclease UvrABC nuclease subunit